MEAIFWQILPVVIIVGLGYAAVRFDFVSQAANEGITRFVFAVALPALMFRNLAITDIAGNLQFIWKILLGYYGGALAVMLLGIFIAKTLMERTGASIRFDNRPEGGARVMVTWPREAIEPTTS